jgi:acetyl-CoA carboxylase biotin carboxyl carrier protein
MSMDSKEIQSLIKFVSKSGVNEVSIEQGEFKITIKTDSGPQEQHYIVQSPQQQMQQAPMQQVAAAPMAAPVAAAATNDGGAVDSAANGNYIEIKSPMIGTFYRKPSPDKDLFVNIGDTIAVGDVICVVEAMKLFNEIESEVAGKIVKVLVEDNSPIEYDQPLFLVDPS